MNFQMKREYIVAFPDTEDGNVTSHDVNLIFEWEERYERCSIRDGQAFFYIEGLTPDKEMDQLPDVVVQWLDDTIGAKELPEEARSEPEEGAQ